MRPGRSSPTIPIGRCRFLDRRLAPFSAGCRRMASADDRRVSLPAGGDPSLPVRRPLPPASGSPVGARGGPAHDAVVYRPFRRGRLSYSYGVVDGLRAGTRRPRTESLGRILAGLGRLDQAAAANCGGLSAA